MFLPTTRSEMEKLGWKELDVILVSGDTYIDSSYNGSAIIGHWLVENGFKTGIICQPKLDSDEDISKLGEPKLFWSVSSGCVDSMVANYTPTLKFRKDDDFTPGGINNKRPDRACIAYTNLIKKFHKGKPIVLGGVEATLRRITHYDLWSNSLRRSVLLDSKADIITYGMGERSNLLLAQCLRDGRDYGEIRGICYMSSSVPDGYVEIPSHEKCVESKDEFIKAFKTVYSNSDPATSKGIAQKYGNRFLIQNPPSIPLKQSELDRVYEMDFENEVHPFYLKQGAVKAMETIRNSVTTHRGCYGECNFCSIALVQGRRVVSRSKESVLREVKRMVSKKGFNGIINDVGGPTANMYGFECPNKESKGSCVNRRCLYPKVCPSLPVDHSKYLDLLESIRSVDGVKKVSIASGIRYDLILADKKNGRKFLEEVCRHHVSGQMKVAPEHVSRDVLKHMGKPGSDVLIEFKNMFDEINEKLGKEQFLTYYLIAAHPGCKEEHMLELSQFCRNRLKTNPEQIQIFTPTPSSISTLMYYTNRDWDNTVNIKVERSMQQKQKQKEILLGAEKCKKTSTKSRPKPTKAT